MTCGAMTMQRRQGTIATDYAGDPGSRLTLREEHYCGRLARDGVALVAAAQLRQRGARHGPQQRRRHVAQQGNRVAAAFVDVQARVAAQKTGYLRRSNAQFHRAPKVGYRCTADLTSTASGDTDGLAASFKQHHNNNTNTTNTSN